VSNVRLNLNETTSLYQVESQGKGNADAEVKVPRYDGPRPTGMNQARKSGRQELPPLRLLESHHASVEPSSIGGSPFAMMAQALAYCIHQFFGEKTLEGRVPLKLPGNDPIDITVQPKMLGRIPVHFTVKDVKSLIGSVQAKVDRGADLLNGLLQGAEVPKPASEKDVADIMWCLQVMAQAKGGDFSEGSMTIPDPGNRIRDFLDSCPAYYQRLSSHINDFQECAYGQHRGIDLYGSASEPDHLLPHEKQTVLYGALNKNDGLHMPEDRLWVKLESHGCYFSNPEIGPDTRPGRERAPNLHDVGAFLGHAWGAVTSKVLDLFGLNSPEGSRKERIPPQMKNAFKQIVDSAPDDVKPLLTAGNPTGNAQGLRVMLNNIASARASDQTADIGMRHVWHSHADEFEKNYLGNQADRYDHPELRFGEEIILTHEDLLSGHDVPLRPITSPSKNANFRKEI